MAAASKSRNLSPPPAAARPRPVASERVAVEAARVQAWEPAPAGPSTSIPAPMRSPLMLGPDVAPWARLLPRVAVAMAALPILFLIVSLVGVGDEESDHALGDDYTQFLAAGRTPVLFQLAMIVCAAGWAAVGAFLLAVARTAQPAAPLRSSFTYAAGVLCAFGVLYGIVGLTGVARLGLDFTVAEGSERFVLAAAYLTLFQVQGALFSIAMLVQGLGFLLAGSALSHVRGVPPGLGGWVVIPGASSLVVWVLGLAANNRPDLTPILGPAYFLHLLALAAVGVVVAARMRRTP